MPGARTRIREVTFDLGARVLIIGFAAAIAIPAVGLYFADDAARSERENRILAPLPALSEATAGRKFFSAMDRYLEDHLGFAVELNQIYRQAVFYVFNDSPSKDLTLGKDGYVFLTSFHNEPYTNLHTLCFNGMNTPAAESISEGWMRLLQRYDGVGKNAALVIVPSKPALYPEKLPRSVPRKYREACAAFRPEASVFGATTAKAEQRGKLVLYPHREFEEWKYDGNFYPRQNFHFAGESAHRTGRLLLSRLGLTPDDAYDQLVRNHESKVDVSKLMGFDAHYQGNFYPYTAYGITYAPGTPRFVRDYYARASKFGTITSAHPLSGRTALVIGNSFTPFLAGHLAPAYRSLTWINVNDLDKDEIARFLTELVVRVDADDLVFVFHDSASQWIPGIWVPRLAALDADGGNAPSHSSTTR